jgi:hypothetical protein
MQYSVGYRVTDWTALVRMEFEHCTNTLGFVPGTRLGDL